MSGATWAIIVAGGEGRRFGRPKQFELLAGQSVVSWAVESARKACSDVVLVLPSDALDDPTQHYGASLVVAGGPTRSASVRAGLSVVPDVAEIVVVHDAARPLASSALFDAVIAAVRAGADAAIPGLPVADTLKRVEDGRVVETLERDGVFAVQTPQAFRAQALRRAHASGADATDDAGLVEAAGGAVVIVQGEVRNVKLTEHADLALFESWIGVARGHAMSESRIGLGVDVHRVAEDEARPFVLGGVTVPGARGLVGHSDADALAHALCDALLGAAALGDIGQHFPDDDVRYENANSIELLRACGALITAEGWRLVNGDCTVVAEAPKLAPHREEMMVRLSDAAGGPVHVKATRPERLGALGRVEGIACLAVVLLER